MAVLKQSTAYTRMFMLVQSADHISGLTGATPTVTLSKAGAAFAAAGGAVTEVASGWYKIALTTTDTNTLGDLAYHVTAASADPTDFVDQVSSVLVSDALTVGTNNDKTGYSLTQAFPANFSSLAITVGGAVTAGTVSDKTGYSLSQTFPTNFSAMAITAGGAVTAGTVSDKTGYSLTQAFPTNFASMAIDTNGNVSTTANIKKNTASSGFMFVMTDATTHAPKTGLTVTATRSLDGAAFAACANAVTEVANGWYKIDLAATDTNANHVALRFTGTGADDLNLEIVTQP